MLNLIIFILLCYSLTYIITESEIFNIRDKVKNKFIYKLIHCNVCTSFWVGLLISILFSISEVFIFNGLISLGSILLIEKITRW